MITIEIFKKNGSIVRYRATGHAYYAKRGKDDIVCASTSTILQFPLAGITELLEIIPRFELVDGNVGADLRGVDYRGKDIEINILLNSMSLMLRELAKEYPKNLKLVEKEDK